MGNAELHRFLQIACGSTNELEYHLLLAKDLDYIAERDHESIQQHVLEVKRMLVALTRKVGSERLLNSFLGTRDWIEQGMLVASNPE